MSAIIKDTNINAPSTYYIAIIPHTCSAMITHIRFCNNHTHNWFCHNLNIAGSYSHTTSYVIITYLEYSNKTYKYLIPEYNDPAM